MSASRHPALSATDPELASFVAAEETLQAQTLRLIPSEEPEAGRTVEVGLRQEPNAGHAVIGQEPRVSPVREAMRRAKFSALAASPAKVIAASSWPRSDSTA